MIHRTYIAGRATRFLFLAVFVTNAGFASAWCQDSTTAPQQGNANETPAYTVEGQYSDAAPVAATPNLNSLNQNASSIPYTDKVRERSPLTFSVEASGAWTNNLLNSDDTSSAQSGNYFVIGVPVGVRLSSPVTTFNAYFRGDSNFYPSYSNLNHTSFVYSHELTHQRSERTTMSWSLAGGRIIEIGTFLAPVINIGSTGVVLPGRPGGLEPRYDAATTFALVHKLSERDLVTASATGGWLDAPEGKSSANSQSFSNRQWTGGGALKWQRVLNTRQTAGVEFNSVYIRGMSPSGRGYFNSALVTFSQTLTPRLTFTGGIGPLFVDTAEGGLPSSSGITYNANAGLDYHSSIAEISGGYSRLYQMNTLGGDAIANRYSFQFDRPITRAIALTSGLNYMKFSDPVHQSGTAYSQFGFSARLDMYLSRKFSYYVDGSSFSLDPASSFQTVYPGYNTGSVTYGVAYHFGDAASRREELQ